MDFGYSQRSAAAARQRAIDAGMFGMFDPRITADAMRDRASLDGSGRVRYSSFNDVFTAAGSRRPRATGFGSYGYFGDPFTDSLNISTITDPSLGATGLMTDATPAASGGASVSTEPSIWDRLFGSAGLTASISTAAQSPQGQGLLSQVVNFFQPNRPGATSQMRLPPQRKSYTPWIIGGAAVLAGFILLKKS